MTFLEIKAAVQEKQKLVIALDSLNLYAVFWPVLILEGKQG